MKKLHLFIVVIVITTCLTSNQNVFGGNPKIFKTLNESYVAQPCTLIITGNLHTRRSGCTRGIGSCLHVRFKLPEDFLPFPILHEGEAKGSANERTSGTITIDPENQNLITIDFLYLDDEQMNESSWDLENDLVIDGPELKDEPGAYKSITLLKGNYEIDRSENKVGRCMVRCKVN